MIPIYENSTHGIGHSKESFLSRFESILDEENCRKCALIFYDFKDYSLKKILEDQEVFIRLDRLSNNNLNIFYLHSGDIHSINEFNTTLIKKLDISSEFISPSIVFFEVSHGSFNNIKIIPLNINLIHGFHNLFEIINEHIQKNDYKKNILI